MTSRKKSRYLFLRHFQGLEVIADDTQFFLKLHDFPVMEQKTRCHQFENENIKVRDHEQVRRRRVRNKKNKEGLRVKADERKSGVMGRFAVKGKQTKNK